MLISGCQPAVTSIQRKLRSSRKPLNVGDICWKAWLVAIERILSPSLWETGLAGLPFRWLGRSNVDDIKPYTGH